MLIILATDKTIHNIVHIIQNIAFLSYLHGYRRMYDDMKYSTINQET